jgi:hypothetical protein
MLLMNLVSNSFFISLSTCTQLYLILTQIALRKHIQVIAFLMLMVK